MELVAEGRLASGGNPVNVYWSESDETFFIEVVDEDGCPTGDEESCIEPSKLKYMVILNEEIEEWAFDNDVFL